MHYALEKVYVKQNNFYPKTLTPDTLPAVDEELFKDPNGIMIGKSGSDFRYEPTGCSNDNKCQSYTIRSVMENEADFVKKGNLDNNS